MILMIEQTGDTRSAEAARTMERAIRDMGRHDVAVLDARAAKAVDVAAADLVLLSGLDVGATARLVAGMICSDVDCASMSIVYVGDLAALVPGCLLGLGVASVTTYRMPPRPEGLRAIAMIALARMRQPRREAS